MRIERSLINRGQVIRLLITQHAEGWQVREEQNSEVRHEVVRRDWHRVERDLRLFELMARALREQGWIDGDARPQPRAA